MKKNVMRVISLVLVAGMLFAFSSCTQKIQISFVDADGNVINPFASSVNAGTNNGGSSSNSGSSNNGGSTVTPTPTPTPTPDASQGSETTTAAPSGDSQGDAPQAGVMPSTTADVVNFYSTAANKIKNEGAAGYTKKEWQNVDKLNVTGSSSIDKTVAGVIGNFMTAEADAKEQLNDKGSDDAKNRFPGWTLTDISQVASATCTALDNGNYKIEIIMKDEDTPKKSGSVLGQVTNSLLYWEDIDDTLKNDPTVTAILSSYDNIHVVYKNYNITAEMTPDGKFVSLDHTADVDILIGSAKILIITLKDKSGHLWNYCKYYNFAY